MAAFEIRSIWTSSELKGYLDFPHANQVFAIRRETTHLVSNKFTTETVYGITSLDPKRANPERLLASSRGHWSIENSLHYVRDHFRRRPLPSAPRQRPSGYGHDP